MLKDVAIKLHSGDCRQYDGVTVTINTEDKLCVIENNLGLRFTCHLDDIVYVEELPCVNQEAIREEVMAVCNNGSSSSFIMAIKRLRELSGMGLKEAKEQVERWRGY